MALNLARSSLPWKRLLANSAVIVASVLFALAVDSWWGRHQERTHAEEYLKQLLVDFKKTDVQLRGAIASETERMEAVNRVIGHALHGPLPDTLELPTGYNQFEPLTGTLTALVQGCDLRLLHSERSQC